MNNQHRRFAVTFSKRFALVITAAAVAATMLVVFTPAATAAVNSGFGGSAYTSVNCDSFNHTIAIKPVVRVDNANRDQRVSAEAWIYFPEMKALGLNPWSNLGRREVKYFGSGEYYYYSPSINFSYGPYMLGAVGQVWVYVRYGWQTSTGWNYRDEWVIQYAQYNRWSNLPTVSKTCIV